MLNWLRYFPLALPFCRKDSEYIIPHGPLFPKLRKQQWYIGKSSFHFSAPWANSVYGSEQLSRYSDSRSPGKQDVLTYELQSISSDVIPNGRWKGSLIYSREWYFVGPWFSGDYGDLRMAAVIYGQPHLEDFKGASFFHPRVFESVIGDFLSSFFGHEKSGRKAYYRGPLHWETEVLSESVCSASFDICSDVDGSIKKYVVFPVSHDRFISIRFSGFYQDVRSYDQTPLINLMNSIISTFRLEVGPDMQAQWDKVGAYCSDMSLTPEYGELKWPVKPQDVGKPIGSVSEKTAKEGSTLLAEKLLLRE